MKSIRKKTVYVVMGKGRCGKSSLIRCLTGVAQASTIQLRLANRRTDVSVSVWVRSAQEAGKSPAVVLRDLNAMNGKTGLISLRLGKYNGQPNGNAYLSTLSQNFNLVIFNINPPRIPSNAIAAIARSQFRWL